MELMKYIPDRSVDMILCDLPYGMTACKWDSIIPFDKLWNEYERIIKDNGAIVLTASQPFTSALVMSNPKLFKYELIWEKGKATGHTLCNIRPMKAHENIVVFSKGKHTYNPQFISGTKYKARNNVSIYKNRNKDWNISHGNRKDNNGFRYPRSVIKLSNINKIEQHPTQKPVELFEYLIRTYSNEGDLVLDNCIGSGTTAVACKQTNRRFIGMDNNQEYVNMANKRLNFTTVGDFNPPTEESLINVKRESADSPNLPHIHNTKLEEVNFS